MADKCAGHNRRGLPCQKPPVPGATVCGLHGGKAPQVKAAAQRRVAEKAAAALLHDLDAAPVTDPVAALQRLAGVVSSAVDVMGSRVNELTSIRYTDAKQAEQLRSEVAIWERLLAQCSRLLVDMVRLGIEDRLAAVEESRLDLLEKAMRAILADPDLHLDAVQQAAAPAVIHRHLSAVNS